MTNERIVVDATAAQEGVDSQGVGAFSIFQHVIVSFLLTRKDHQTPPVGTGLGAAMIVDGIVEPMELGHLPYREATYEDYVGLRGLERNGKKQWRRDVAEVVAHLIAALEPSDTVIGGGNVKKLKELPPTAARAITPMLSGRIPVVGDTGSPNVPARHGSGERQWLRNRLPLGRQRKRRHGRPSKIIGGR